MKFIKQDLLTLLIGLFLFSACKDSSTIGLEPDDASKIKGELVDTVSILQSTAADEVTSTLGQPRYPLGAITGDPIFGSTEASLSMAVSLPGGGYDFGDGPLVDSAVLILPYVVPIAPSTSMHFYGDTTTSVYSFNVQQLENDLTLQKSFLSNQEWAVKDPVVGSFTGKIKPRTRTEVIDIVPGKPDTARLISTPQIRIRLDNSFIQNNILNLDSATRSKNSKFTLAFKGLKISVNKGSSSGPGGIAFLDFTSTDALTGAGIAIYYKKLVENSLIQRDTASTTFPISVSSGPIAATIKHDYTGTPVETQLNEPKPAAPYQVTYLHALAGLRNKISFPYLKDLVNKIKEQNPASRIVINRAELVVNVSNGSDVAPYTPAERLSLYRLDIAGQRINLTDNDASTGYQRYAGSDVDFGGFYDRTNKRYIFTVTAYLQDLIDGKTIDYGTYLAPSAFPEFNLSPSVSSATRSVIATKFAAGGDKAIKLNIYYTRVD